MGSPTSSKPAPSSPAAQESPFSSFVCRLSPIVPTNRVETVHSDVTIPSPQPVFTSPHISIQFKSKFLRSQKPALSGTENFSLRHTRSTGNLPDNVDICAHSISRPVADLSQIQNELNNNALSPDQSSTSPSNCVNQFLADPLADSDGLGSAVLCLNHPDGVPCCKQSGTSNGNDAEFHQRNFSKFVSTFIADQDGRDMTTLSHPYVRQVTDLPEAFQSGSTIGQKATMELDTSSSYASSGLAHLPLEHLVVTEQASDSNIVHTGGNLRVMGEASELEEEALHQQREPVLSSSEDRITADLHLNVSVPQRKVNSLDNIPMDNCSLESRNKEEKLAGCRKEMTATASFSCHGTQEESPHIAQTGHRHEVSTSPQMKLEYLQNIETDGDHQFDSRSKHNTFVESDINAQKEVAQQQCVMRKRLQFEVVENYDTTTGCNRSSSSLKSDISDMEESHTPFGFGSMNMHHADSTSKTISVNLSGNSASGSSLFLHETSKTETHVEESDRPIQTNNRSSCWTAHRPFGIGLHLNSLGNATSMNVNVNIHLPEKELDAQEDNSVGNNHVPRDSMNCVALTCLTSHSSMESRGSSENAMLCSATLKSEMMHKENQTNDLSNSSLGCHSSFDVKPLNSRLPLKFIKDRISPCNMKRPSSEDITRSEESLQMSPKKRRKKVPENDGGKYCSCKKSKCLKLYCDCFADGAYCREGCTCLDCSNKEENNIVVKETRQQIESRNPLAFAPKVVSRVTESQKNTGNDKHITPSRRHKRGCNCKKSTCLKKYCECYQAGVGCSLGCRCEGCKNPFGRKDGCGEIIELEHNTLQKEMRQHRFEEADFSGEKWELMGIKGGTISVNHCHSGLSPLTPYLQNSNEMEGPKSQFPVPYYPSPDSGSSPNYAESPSSSKASGSNNSFIKRRERTLFTLPYDQELECQTTMKVVPFSPRWDSFVDNCNLYQLQTSSLSATGSSPMSNVRESTILQNKLLPGSSHLPTGSLCWRSSPATPSHQFGEGKLVVEPDSDNAIHYMLEDDTPDLLKDSHSPIKTVQATSPNKKRVSPPKNRLSGKSSSTPPGIRSSRKYVLQSVPSFPSLTPYSNNARGHGT